MGIDTSIDGNIVGEEKEVDALTECNGANGKSGLSASTDGDPTHEETGLDVSTNAVLTHETAGGDDVDASTDGDRTNDGVDSTIDDDETGDGDWGLVSGTKTRGTLVDGNWQWDMSLSLEKTNESTGVDAHLAVTLAVTPRRKRQSI